jgi:DNA-binding XRE family transcriptional regulator
MTAQRKERVYSRYSLEAAQLLGHLIRLARKERKITEMDLAERAGIARATLQRIEKGDPGCEIGTVFEVATIVGVKLFDADSRLLSMQMERVQDKIALLPKSIRKTAKVVDDDF